MPGVGTAAAACNRNGETICCWPSIGHRLNSVSQSHGDRHGPRSGGWRRRVCRLRRWLLAASLVEKDVHVLLPKASFRELNFGLLLVRRVHHCRAAHFGKKAAGAVEKPAPNDPRVSSAARPSRKPATALVASTANLNCKQKAATESVVHAQTSRRTMNRCGRCHRRCLLRR